MQFRVLGPLEVWRDGVQVQLVGIKQAKALAIMLLEIGHIVPLHRLVDALWDQEPPSTAKRQAQNTVAALRRLLAAAGADPIERCGGGYRLTTPNLDWLAFEADVARAREYVAAGRLRDAQVNFKQGLSRWRGPALTALPGEMIASATQCLDRARTSALEDLIGVEVGLGDNGQAIVGARKLLLAEPYRQRTTGHLMLALHRDARKAEALEVYADLRGRLADELGLDPEPALQLLHQQIIRDEVPPPRTATASTTERPETFAATPPPAMLPPAIAAFTGRSEELSSLDALLDADETRLAAITGTAGVGKTTLALHWAHRVAYRFPDGHLFVNLRGFEPQDTAIAPEEAVTVLLGALGVPHQRMPPEPQARFGLYRSLMADQRTLVVLDNAADSAQVRPLIPSGRGNFTLVTSRNSLHGIIAAQAAKAYPVRELPIDVCRNLFRKRLGTEAVDADPEAVDRIIDLCARLPLALAVMIAMAIVHPEASLRHIAQELGVERDRLDIFSGDDAATDIRAVFACSVRGLEPGSARLFRLLSLHPGPEISVRAAASLLAATVAEAKRCLRALAGEHLVVETRPGRYAFHDLLRTYALELVHATDDEAERRSATHRMLDHYLHTAVAGSRLINPNRIQFDPSSLDAGSEPEPLTDRAQAMDWFADEYEVLVGSINVGSDTGFDTQTWQLGAAMFEFLFRQRARTEGLAVLETALLAAQRQNSVSGQIHIERSLAVCSIDSGDLDQARAHLEKTLALCRSEGNDLLLAQATLGLSRVCGREGDHVGALHYAGQALDLYERVGNGSGFATTLGTIAWYHAQLENFETSIDYCRRALEFHEASGALAHQSAVWDTMGYVNYQQRLYEQAVECYRTAISLAGCAGHRAQEAGYLFNLANVYESAGDDASARQTWCQSLTIYEDLHHPTAAVIRERLGPTGGPPRVACRTS